VILPPLEYTRAPSLDDALDALSDPDSKALAGGQSLLPVLKLRLVRPTLLVDIARLPLRGVAVGDGELRLGALATWSELLDAAPLRRPALAGISECAAGVGDLQVRNRGTVGGSLAHADPSSDLPAVVLSFAADIRVRSRGGERTIGAADLCLGPFTTSLAPGELITEVAVPVPPAGSGSAYVCVEHPASGFALAGAAAFVAPGGTRVALTGVGAAPFLIAAEDPRQALEEAEVFGDGLAPAEYRRQLATVVVERALARARARAEEDARWSE
jgi:carbon-monoxide dehydrogenase medium subunit